MNLFGKHKKYSDEQVPKLRDNELIQLREQNARLIRYANAMIEMNKSLEKTIDSLVGELIIHGAVQEEIVQAFDNSEGSKTSYEQVMKDLEVYRETSSK